MIPSNVVLGVILIVLLIIEYWLGYLIYKMIKGDDDDE